MVGGQDQGIWLGHQQHMQQGAAVPDLVGVSRVVSIIILVAAAQSVHFWNSCQESLGCAGN